MNSLRGDLFLNLDAKTDRLSILDSIKFSLIFGLS